MNRTCLYVAAFVLVVGAYYIYGIMQYREGWKEGQAALVAQQHQQQQARLEKQVTRQQQNDAQAAVAEQQGAARTVTITQEVVKYIKTPGRNVCTFDEARVKLKQSAVDNANRIEGYDRE
ncbi:hypothetical protein G3R67_003417 [Salmonella enterica subsp. enterica serovar Agona]|nr:hypothetical protein [Salmonella enterica subsp. enterica serovar Agona]EJW5798231.1 hypothetical protein [Salmonella enterica]